MNANSGPQTVGLYLSMMVAISATFVSIMFTLGYSMSQSTPDMTAITLPIMATIELSKVAIPFWAASLWKSGNYKWARMFALVWLMPAFGSMVAYDGFHITTEQAVSKLERLESEMRSLRDTPPLSQLQRQLRESGDDPDLKDDLATAQKRVELKNEISALKWVRDHGQTPKGQSSEEARSHDQLVLILLGVELMAFLSWLAVAKLWPEPTGGGGGEGKTERTLTALPSASPASPDSRGAPQASAFLQQDQKLEMGYSMPEAKPVVYRGGLRSGDSIQVVKKKWLMPGVLLEGKLALIAGQGGVGKSAMAANLAAAVTNGGLWPTGDRAQKKCVIYFEYEDDADSVTTPRLILAGADVSLMEISEEIHDLSDDFSIIEEAEARLIKKTGLSVGAVFFSPIRSFFGKRESYNESEVRARLRLADAWSARSGAAIIGVTHTTKDGAKVAGSEAWLRAARCGLKAVWDNNLVGGTRHIEPLKANSGKVGWVLPYTTVEAANGDCNDIVVQWGEKTFPHEGGAPLSNGTATQLASPSEPWKPTAHEQERAMAFLGKIMKSLGATDGEFIVVEDGAAIVKAAAEERIAQTTLNRAAERMGITLTPRGRTNEWKWRAPDAADI